MNNRGSRIFGYTFQIGVISNLTELGIIVECSWIYLSNWGYFQSIRIPSFCLSVGYTLQIGIISNSIFKGTYRVTISTNSYLSFSIETNLSLCSVLSLGPSNRPVLKCQ